MQITPGTGKHFLLPLVSRDLRERFIFKAINKPKVKVKQQYIQQDNSNLQLSWYISF